MTDLGDFPRLQSHVNSVHPEGGQDLTDTVIDNVKGEIIFSLAGELNGRPTCQGFICPFCMTDLGDFPRLQSHVNSVHPEGGQDLTDTVIDNVKGEIIFSLAGELNGRPTCQLSVVRLQVNIGVSNSVADLASMASAVQEKARPARPPAIVRPPPVRAEIGVTRSQTEYFRKIRDSSVNESAVRTNMLIIRLDRLINECPCDPSKRKEFEREVVPWSADSESLHCTRCAAKFSIARRRHHCRLCGRVMCHQCSQFLSFLSARKLTNPALAAEMLNNDAVPTTAEASPSHSRRLLEMTQKTTGKVISFIEGAVSKIQTTDGSEVSLGSLLQQDAQECLRVCGSCMADLSRREQMMEQRNPPALAEQYETLDRMIAEASAMVPSYTRMSDSINNGETMYALAAAEQLRSRLLQKQRDIDSLSQSIVAEAENENCGVKEAQLRKNIRFACVQTLQSIMSSLVSLPTAQQYEKLVEIHKKEVARQIEESRMRAANEVVGVRASSSLPSVALKDRSPVSVVHERTRKQAADGWTPQQTRSYNPFMEEEDRMHPMFEQRDIIKGYLAQAATAGRLEEVEMLERNLRDLEDEMLKMGLISPT
ncbi:FYVE zinc finger [Ostertagia ostertagi]